MPILDGKNPRLFYLMPTTDGKWMVEYTCDGARSRPYAFAGAKEDIEAACTVLNQREMDAYQEASTDAMLEQIRAGWPTIEEIIQSTKQKNA